MTSTDTWKGKAQGAAASFNLVKDKHIEATSPSCKSSGFLLITKLRVGSQPNKSLKIKKFQQKSFQMHSVHY